MTTTPNKPEPSAQDAMRAAFEEWLQREHMLDSEWDETRNCFKDFPAHLSHKAFKAGAQWQASRAPVVQSVPHPIDCLREAMDRGEVQGIGRVTLIGHFCNAWNNRLHATSSAPQAVAAPDRAVAYAIYGIGGGLVYLKEVKEIPKSDTTGEWRGDDGGLGDYWAGNESLALMGKQAPQPIAAPADEMRERAHRKGAEIGDPPCGVGPDWTAAEEVELHAVLAEYPVDPDHEFKNFHRNLCERFNYTHDERDWKRDQVSLVEHIAASQQPVPVLCPICETGELIAFRSSVCHSCGVETASTEDLRVNAKAAQLVQQRATLSDAQIEALVPWQGDPNDPFFDRIKFARAILAATGDA